MLLTLSSRRTATRSVPVSKRVTTFCAGILAAAILSGCAVQSSSPTANKGEPVSAILSAQMIDGDANYPQAHASSIAETLDGKLVATWFAGVHERHPNVGIYIAHFENGSWQKAVEVANGKQPDGTFQPTWNPVLFQPEVGDLLLFYKVGPNPREWWGMVMRSADGGRTWGTPERLPDGILGPIKNKPIVTNDGSWLSPSSSETMEVWHMHFERSKDQGKTWTKSEMVNRGPGIDAIQPSVLVHADGRMQAVARTKQGALASAWSSDRGITWTPVSAIDLPNPSSGTDAVTLKDGRHLIIYNHSAHRPDTPGKGVRYPLNLAISDDGISWTPILTLEDKPLVSGYAYPAMIQSADGLVHLTYTWDRKRIKHVVVDPAKL